MTADEVLGVARHNLFELSNIRFIDAADNAELCSESAKAREHRANLIGAVKE